MKVKKILSRMRFPNSGKKNNKHPHTRKLHKTNKQTKQTKKWKLGRNRNGSFCQCLIPTFEEDNWFCQEFQEYFQSLELCSRLINSAPAKTSTRPKLGIAFIYWCSRNRRLSDHDDFIKTASASPGGFVGLLVIIRRNERIGFLPSYL